MYEEFQKLRSKPFPFPGCSGHPWSFIGKDRTCRYHCIPHIPHHGIYCNTMHQGGAQQTSGEMHCWPGSFLTGSLSREQQQIRVASACRLCDATASICESRWQQHFIMCVCVYVCCIVCECVYCGVCVCLWFLTRIGKWRWFLLVEDSRKSTGFSSDLPSIPLSGEP